MAKRVGTAARSRAPQLHTAERIDDQGVNTFAELMKAKLAKKRSEGAGGWHTASPEHLARLLVEHVAKGDMIDVANFCMMLHQRMALMGYHVGNPEVRRAPLSDAASAHAEGQRVACLEEFMAKLMKLVERS